MTDDQLQKAGFTQSGSKRYSETIKAYAETLYSKSVIYAEANKAKDTGLEVTHDHVRSAAHNITTTFGSELNSRWAIPLQIFEYLLTATAGVGGGNLEKSWGTPVFVISVALAVILFVVRNTYLKRK